MSEKLEESGGGAVIEMTGRIMLLAIILFSLLISVLVFLHLYRRRRLRHHDGTNINITTIGGGGGIGSRGSLNTTSQARGLDPSTIPPVIVFSPKQFKDGLECSVCLSELSLGEETRVLPKCNHAFHAQCIDMWFHSHSTCPICRTPVFISNPQTHPTNLLYWGSNHVVDTTTTTTTESTTVTSSSPTTTTTTTVTSSSPAAATTTTVTSSSSSPVVNDHLNDLVIEIPRQNNLLEEDDKSPVVVDSRLSAALKTLFS